MKGRDKYFRNVDKKTSFIMSKIPSSNTSIEKKLCKLLRAKGYKYRRNDKKILGKPDIVFKQQKLLIFCDSSFWHGKSFKAKVLKIRKNRKYWVEKIATNMKRDKKISRKLRAMNWSVLRFWDTDIEKNPEKVLTRIERYLR